MLSDPERRRTYDAFGHEGLRSGGWAPRAGRLRRASRTSSGVLRPSATRCSASCSVSAAGAGPASGGDVGARVEVEPGGRARRASGARSRSRRSSDCERCRGNGAEPGTPIETCETCGGSRRAPRGRADRLRPGGAGRRLPDLRRRRAGSPRRPARGAAARAGPSRSRDLGGRGSGRDRVRPADPDLRRRARRRGRGRRPGDLYVEVVVADDERFERQGTDLVARARGARDTRDARRHGDRRRRSTASARSRSRPGAQPGEHVVLRGLGLPSLRGRGAAATSTSSFEVVRARRAERGAAGAGRAARRDARARQGSRQRRPGTSSASGAAASARRGGDPARRSLPPGARRAGARRAGRAGARRGRGGARRRATWSTRSTAPPGELPALPDLEAVAGDGLVEVSTTEIPDDWADRWQDFHRPIEVGGRLWVRPSWEEPRRGHDRRRRRSRPGVRHRRPPDDPDVPRAAARAGRRGRGARRRSPTGAPARGCWRSPRRSWASARSSPATTSRRRSRRPAPTPRSNGGRARAASRGNLREQRPAVAPTVGRQPDRAAAARGRAAASERGARSG